MMNDQAINVSWEEAYEEACTIIGRMVVEQSIEGKRQLASQRVMADLTKASPTDSSGVSSEQPEG